MTPALNRAVINVLNSASARELRRDGEEMRTLLDRAKDEAAQNFTAVLQAWRAEGPLAEADHRAIFARSIARRAGVDEATVNVDFVVQSLHAHYIFEKHRMHVGAQHHDYNVTKHSNDVFDAELLIYLADPSLHLLTSDRGYRRVETSTQFSRIHIVQPDHLTDPDRATLIIRGIVEAAGRI